MRVIRIPSLDGLRRVRRDLNTTSAIKSPCVFRLLRGNECVHQPLRSLSADNIFFSSRSIHYGPVLLRLRHESPSVIYLELPLSGSRRQIHCENLNNFQKNYSRGVQACVWGAGEWGRPHPRSRRFGLGSPKAPMHWLVQGSTTVWKTTIEIKAGVVRPACVRLNHSCRHGGAHDSSTRTICCALSCAIAHTQIQIVMPGDQSDRKSPGGELPAPNAWAACCGSAPHSTRVQIFSACTFCCWNPHCIVP